MTLPFFHFSLAKVPKMGLLFESVRDWSCRDANIDSTF